MCVSAQGRAALEQSGGELVVERRESPAAEVAHFGVGGGVESAGAYLGQVGNIQSKKILAAAGSILPIEARHAGWIRDLNGVSGAPTAFQGAKSKAAILAAVKKTGFITGTS